MGTKYNSEGYRDPTAHLGIVLAEPEKSPTSGTYLNQQECQIS